MIDEKDLFDAIIVGSGVGGLTAGAFLSKNGKKVLILEQHSVVGGYLHGFYRKKIFFDSAVYSIAGCGDNGYVKYVLKKLSLDKEFNFIEHDSIYKLISPIGEWRLPVGIDNFYNYLSNLFPKESNNIKRFIDEGILLYDLFEKEKFDKSIDKDKYSEMLSKWGTKNYKEFIDSFITDEKLAFLLYSLWLFCALPDSKTSALYSVLMLFIHIIESSYYIEGGCDHLAKVLAKYIADNVGIIKCNTMVNEILFESGIAKGVATSDGEKYFSRTIIANCSAKMVVNDLVKSVDNIPNVLKRRINKLSTSLSCFALYLAVKTNIDVKDPFAEANQIFYHENMDNEKSYNEAIDRGLPYFSNLIITKIPTVNSDDKDIVRINVYSLVSIDKEEDWALKKEELTKTLIMKMKNMFKGYIKEIIVCESGTPKTFYRYTLNSNGAMYGFENSYLPYNSLKIDNNSGIKNLFFAGHWTTPGGSVYNAMTSGEKASKLALEYL
jgi:prolycopene isomerase